MEAGVRRRSGLARHASRFAPEQDDVAGLEVEIRKRDRAVGLGKDEAMAMLAPPLVEGRKGIVPGNGGAFEIVHAGAAEMPVRHVEGGRLDDIDGEAEAGGHADHRPGVLRDVRLEKGETKHAGVMTGRAARRQGRQMGTACSRSPVGVEPGGLYGLPPTSAPGSVVLRIR